MSSLFSFYYHSWKEATMWNQERNTEATDDAIICHRLRTTIFISPWTSSLTFSIVSLSNLSSNSGACAKPSGTSSLTLPSSPPTFSTTAPPPQVPPFSSSNTAPPPHSSLLQSQNPNNLVHPFPNHTRDLHLIGSINGLLCLCHCLSLSLPHHPLHSSQRIILLWNPATKHITSLPPPTIQIPRRFFHLSLGFGFRSPFDSTSSATDYKVVRIVSFKLQTRVEVCSAISNCWRQIQVMDLRFYIHKLSCEVIVNGASYWLLSTASNHCLCFTWFDVQNEAFVMLLGLDFSGLDFSGFYEGTSVHWKLMEWNDNADVVVCGSGNPYVDGWMMGECCGGERNWCKKFVIGPILGVERFWLLQCTKNGEIIAEDAQEGYSSTTPKMERLSIFQSMEFSSKLFTM